MADQSSPLVRARIANACDNCKARKVKCDGKSPCGYCTRRRTPLVCHFSPQRRRLARPAEPISRSSLAHSRTTASPQSTTPQNSQIAPPSPSTQLKGGATGSPPVALAPPEEDADVPREARLVRDAQGKLVFIGDCAPLSFYQSVRQLVTTRIDPSAFPPQTSQPSVLQHSHPRQDAAPTLGVPRVQHNDIAAHAQMYLNVSTGLVDLFGDVDLSLAIQSWAVAASRTSTTTSVVFPLVLAIGAQSSDHDYAQVLFNHAKAQALASLDGELGIETVQAFILITLYMLGSLQTNAAFIFFGIAVRSAFAIGIHRTEANAMFGPRLGRQRDRLWKSLRVVDLYLSTSMGRPPATSEVDCTVPYNTIDEHGKEAYDLLDASVQILLIMEGMVVEVYSRRMISLDITEGLSSQLREWSARWLSELQHMLSKSAADTQLATVSAACQILATYYYAVMLVSRPFLMYEVLKRLSDGPQVAEHTRNQSASGKARLADACIDAATILVDSVTQLLNSQSIRGRMPLLVSWLFSASLVLGLGLLGGFGRSLEKQARAAIRALDHFAAHDAHAMQYSLISSALVDVAISHLERRDLEERQMRTQCSTQLFGLTPRSSIGPSSQIDTSTSRPHSSSTPFEMASAPSSDPSHHQFFRLISPAAGEGLNGTDDPTDSFANTLDLSTFDGLFDNMSDKDWGSINLFPLLEDGSQSNLSSYM